MNPLPIAAACVDITVAIAILTERITAIVSTVREARKDLDAIRRELGSLQLSLAVLTPDDEKYGFDRTPDLKANLKCVLGNCSRTIDEINATLSEVVGAQGELKLIGKTGFLTSGKARIEKLRGGLEAHKRALDIALDLIAISIIVDIKADTSILKEDTSKIKQDTHVILEEIGKLQEQVATLDISHDREFVIRRFLDSSTVYAESIENIETVEDDPEGLPYFLNNDLPYPDIDLLGSSTQGIRDGLLVDAAKSSNICILKQLLQCGADVDNGQGRGHRTAIAWAILKLGMKKWYEHYF